MNEPLEFRKVRDFGEVIGDTFLFIKQNFKPLMTGVLAFCSIFLAGGLISYLVMNLQLSGIMDASSGRTAANPFVDMLFNFGVGYAFMVLFYVLCYTAFYVSVLGYIALYVQKGNVAPSLHEQWSYFKYYFLRVLGSGILMTMLLVIAFICCIIPGIWIMPAVTLFYPVMVLENGSFSHAFGRAFDLLKQHWWVTFGTILVIGIISEACKWVVQFPALIIAWSSAFTHLEQPITKTYAVVTSVAQFLSLIFMVIPIVGSALLYFNLVERKESAGLMGRIAGLGGSSTADAAQPEEY